MIQLLQFCYKFAYYVSYSALMIDADNVYFNKVIVTILLVVIYQPIDSRLNCH